MSSNLISSALLQPSPSTLKPLDGHGVTTVETAAATIRFMINADDVSESESESDEDSQGKTSEHTTTSKHMCDSVNNASTVDQKSNPPSKQIESNNVNQSNVTEKQHYDDSIQTMPRSCDTVGVTIDTGALDHVRAVPSSNTQVIQNQALSSDSKKGPADCIDDDRIIDMTDLDQGQLSQGVSKASKVNLHTDQNSIASRNQSDVSNCKNPSNCSQSNNFNSASCDDSNKAYNKLDNDIVENNTDYTEQIRRMKNARFNPFDRDVAVFEDHYSNSLDQPATQSNKLPQPANKEPTRERAVRPRSLSSTTSDTWSDGLSWSLLGESNDVITNAELGLAEDHFSQPDGHFGLSTIEELEMAIRNCKAMVMEAPEKTDRRRGLVRKLVQLRMQLAEAKEGPEEQDPSVKLVLGHQLIVRTSGSSKHYCEKCNSVIWGMLQEWYKCNVCGFCCHEKCLSQITRTCASVKIAENASYILSISPEKGMASQNYRCAECKTPITNKSGFSEPRQCDYNGLYYCEKCHWNDTTIIPARVLHNWDFEPRKVCRASKQFLRLMLNKAVIRIQDINPMLFSFVEELNEVKKLREEIIVMKKYFLSCQAALESKLLLQLTERQHFVDNSDMYSLQDLWDTRVDLLLPQLAKVHSSFAQHIKTDCQLCQAKGFICELCDMQEVLFPFDNIAIVCPQCVTVLHRHCFVKRQSRCPRCDRRNRRGNSKDENANTT